MTGAPLLRLRSFGVAFGDRVILADVGFDLPPRGVLSCVGPAGSGKSTLLRTIAGLNDAHPSLSTWGTALLGGAPLPAVARPGEVRPGVSMVLQHARFYLDSVRENLVSVLPNRAALEPAAQTRIVCAVLTAHGLAELTSRLDLDVASLPAPVQRRLAIVRAILPGPRLLLADEPTADLDEASAMEVVSLLRGEGRARAVLFVTHDQRVARAAGGTTMLLAGGVVQEIAPAAEFFDAPRTPNGQRFVRTGGCAAPSPGADPADLDEEAARPAPLPAASEARSRWEGPRNFFWLVPGRLGGLPRPGIVDPVDADLAGLRRLGVTTLVTLEESCPIEPARLAGFGIGSIHFPVADMGVPAPAAARELCARVDSLLHAGEVVALHCRAGLGRTGTLLACQLIAGGERARLAIERVRRLNPQCIQSSAQVEFLSAFESYLRACPASPGAGASSPA